MKKILIIKHGSLGDLILSFGAIKTIKHYFPKANLFLLTQTNFKEIFKDLPYVDNIFEDNNSTTLPLENTNDKNSEENLVKDLKDSLRESVDLSLNMLNSLMDEIQEKVEDESVKDDTKKLVNLLSENILNLTGRSSDEMRFNENLEQSKSEEE